MEGDPKLIEGTVYDGNNLERIFELQTDYMLMLKDREAFPDWPLNINIKDHQKIIRDIASRLVVELSESYEVTQEITDIAINNKLSEVDIVPLLKNLNEELADSLHFMVELFILVGITPQDINKFYEDYLDEMNLKATYYKRLDTFRTVTNYAKHMNIWEGYYKNRPSMFLVLKIEDEDEDTTVMAGRYNSMDALIKQTSELWMVVHSLNMAINMLKKKEHRNAGPATHHNLFCEELIKSWVRLFKYYDMVGVSAISIYENYTIKNEINKDRLKNEY